MNKLLPLLLVAAGFAVAVPAHAADEVAAPEKPAKVKKICRTDTATGSIMPKRICHTAEEWAVIDQQNGDAARTAMDRNREGSMRLGSNGVPGASLSDR